MVYQPLGREKMWAFAVDLTATQTAHLLRLDRKTVNRYYGLFRAAIHAHQCRQIAALVGVVECDESYFGQARPHGVPGPRKRGRGTNTRSKSHNLCAVVLEQHPIEWNHSIG